MNKQDEKLLSEVSSISGLDCLKEESIKKALSIEDKFARESALIALEGAAKAIGQVRNFNKLVKIAINKSLQGKTPSVDAGEGFMSTVSGFDLPLNTGEWICDDSGVRKFVERNGNLVEEPACWQPVLINAIFFNKETNTYRVQLAFKDSENSKIKTVTVSKSLIASSATVTALADYGIAITNQTSPSFVKYLNDLERLNVDRIPRSVSISRVGWVGKDCFIPYDTSISFDGETMYKELFDAIKCEGDYDEWKEMVLNEESLEAKAVLGASFASPLVGLLDTLTFFTHLWGNTGNGKSVSLGFAQSVWGNPSKLVQNVNGTAVALERFAGFFCNLPLCLDELQTLKKSNIMTNEGTFDDIIYRLGQGRGKARGKRDGSVDRTQTWALSIITTGEEPITTDNSGGGAKNRVLDLYCKGNIFTNASRVYRTCHDNYGWAGKDFITKLMEYVKTNTIKPIRDLYDSYFGHITSFGVTEKQAMAVTMVGLGYAYMQMFVFGMSEADSIMAGKDLINKIKPMLITVEQINNIEQVYTDLLSYVYSNKHHFAYKPSSGIEYVPTDQKLEAWGKITDNITYISSSAFQTYCRQHGLSYRKIMQSLVESGKLESHETDISKTTKPIRINGCMVRCLALKNPAQMQMQEIKEEDLPF